MFEQGMRAYIKETAFGDSTEPDDIYARGKIGTLIRREDNDGLWLWRDDAGREAFPIEDELEEECPKGGAHQWGTDGQHSNEYCKKCFVARPKP